MAFVDPSQVTPAPTSQQVGMNAPIPSGGAGLAGAPVPKAQAQAGATAPVQPSAQLQTYLNANQDQATNFAGQIAPQIGAGINSAGAAVLPAQNVYTGALTNVADNPTLDTQVQNSPSSLTSDQQAAYEQELQAGANVPNSASTFETSAPYAGLVSGIQNAVEQANLWNQGNNPAALTTALQPYEAPGATGGVQNLDAYLLSQTPGAYSQIQSAVAPATQTTGAGSSPIEQSLTSTAATADQALQNAIATDTATTGAAQTAAQGYETNLTNAIASQLASAQGAATTQDAQNAQILADINSGNLSASDISAMGLTQAQGQALESQAMNTMDIEAITGINKSPTAGITGLAQYLNPATNVNPGSITNAEVATPTQYADLAALDSMLGANAPTNLPISSATAAQAGTAGVAKAPTLDLAAAQQAYQSEDALANQVAALQAKDNAIESEEQNAIQQYQTGGNHFGGQSVDQMNSLIQNWNQQMAALNSQITSLAPTANTDQGASGLTAPGNGGILGNIIDNYVAPAAEVALPILVGEGLTGPGPGYAPQLLDDAPFSAAQGGMVPRPKNLKSYLGVKA